LSELLDYLDARCVSLTRRIAFIGVFGMLAVTALEVFDVLARWLWDGSVPGLNEVLAMGLAATIASTFPAGAAGRINLAVDILASRFGARVLLWLRTAGAFFLLIFYVLLAWRLIVYANELTGRGAMTVILQWPQAPFIYAVAGFIALTAVVQGVVALVDLRNALAGQTSIAAAGFADFLNSEQATGAAANVPSRILVPAALLAVALTALVAFGAHALALSIGSDALSHGAIVGIGLFLLMWALVMLVFPLGAAMALVGLFGSIMLTGSGPALSVLASEPAGFLTNEQVATLPLFLMMGSFAVAGGLSNDIYSLAHKLVGHLRGGLALATIGGCGGFGALTGSSMATAATIGRVALPEMNARGYSLQLATGCVAAGGTLGALVPPSVPLIFYALLTNQSIGVLFIASFVPALLAIALYMLTVLVYTHFVPSSVPPDSSRVSFRELVRAFRDAWEVIALFAMVIGGLYGGVFTATECAAFGAGGTFIVALYRGKLRQGNFIRVMGETTATTAMLYVLIFGAVNFSFFMGLTGAPEIMTDFFANLHLPAVASIFVLLAIYIMLGAVMDSFPVMLITVPIITPFVQNLGYDLVWWGIVMVCVMETGMITPPFGLNVFIMKSIGGSNLPLTTVFKGVMPFVAADLVKLVLLVLFPVIAIWLPKTMLH
jgi:tripartite ATP-independent transporter DctM subunit